MNDLLALAILRRTVLQSASKEDPAAPFGWLEVWMQMPNAELAGLSPLQAMRSPERLPEVQAVLIKKLSVQPSRWVEPGPQ